MITRFAGRLTPTASVLVVINTRRIRFTYANSMISRSSLVNPVDKSGKQGETQRGKEASTSVVEEYAFPEHSYDVNFTIEPGHGLQSSNDVITALLSHIERAVMNGKYEMGNNGTCQVIRDGGWHDDGHCRSCIFAGRLGGAKHEHTLTLPNALQ